jgi:hypothetical protein
MNGNFRVRRIAAITFSLWLSHVACARMAAQQHIPLGRLNWGTDSRNGSQIGTTWTDVSLSRAWSAGYDPAFAAGNAAVTDWLDSARASPLFLRYSSQGIYPEIPGMTPP